MSLSCRHLGVRFGDVTALDDVDLDVATGEIVAVMGPSGSGKSTLLRVVAGLQPPATGTVSWDGADLTATPPHRRGFGLMFQDFALFPHRDVARNVAFGLEMAGLPRHQIDSRVAEMLGLVGLEGYGDRPVTVLSGGEQQRVALARTLAPRPRLVMLDEPVASLDRALRERLVVEMRDIFKGLGVTSLYVTHDREEAFEISDRVAVMREGRIVASGTPRDLWADPGSAFVARFLGHDNVVTATASGGILHIGALEVPTPLGDGTHLVVVPTEAVSLRPGGDSEVVSSVFRGGANRLEVRTGDVTLVTLSPDAFSPGDRVTVEVDPEGVVALTDE